jgi:hypothetical protein
LMASLPSSAIVVMHSDNILFWNARDLNGRAHRAVVEELVS